MKRFLILLVVVTTLLVLALGVSAVVAQPADGARRVILRELVDS